MKLAHIAFKNAVLSSCEGDTKLILKELTPVRMLKNKFYESLVELYKSNPSKETLQSFLGTGRAKLGMFEGDLESGKLEIGQISALIDKLLPVSSIVKEIIDEYNFTAQSMRNKLLK